MTQNSNPGNFANDREKAAKAGQTGGQHSSGQTGQHAKGDSDKSHTSGQQSGNFATDRERASEAGRKGGSK